MTPNPNPTDQAARAAAREACPWASTMEIDDIIQAYIAAQPPANVEAEREAMIEIASNAFFEGFDAAKSGLGISLFTNSKAFAAIRARSQKAQP